MQQFFIGFIMIILCGIGACTAPIAQEEEAQEYHLPKKQADYYTLVVAKHDTAMLLMGDIERTQRALRELLPQHDGEEKKQVLEALTTLQRADEGMMTWMHEFKSTELYEKEYKTLSEAAIQQYLEEEEKKIEQVHIDMSSSIAIGQALLAKLK